MRALVLATLAACGGASADPGLGALLQVDGAQYRPGAFPADTGGPAVVGLQSRHAALTIGRLDEAITGTLDAGARGAVIGVAGLDDAWLITAGVPELDTPGLPSGKATVGLADGFPAGPFTLVMAASDARGRFGPPATLDLVAEPDDPPTGELVIELVWDGRADLDLHVVDALGGEAWSDDPNTYVPPPPGAPPDDPLEFKQHGILDHDGNQDCHRDGRPTEHVVWTVPPPAGDYVVRVDTRALCGAPDAVWFVAAYRNGELVGAARGVTTQADVLQPHGAGAGVLALRFTL